MTSVPAFWGTPQRPTSVSSHSETSTAERYRNSKEQGRRARATMISHTVGVTRTPSDLFCTGLQQVLPRETASTAAVAALQISPAFTSQVFPFVDASHLIMLSSTTAPSGAWDTHLLRLLWLHKRRHEPRCLQLPPTTLCTLGAAFPAVYLHTTSLILITSFYCREHKCGEIP